MRDGLVGFWKSRGREKWTQLRYLGNTIQDLLLDWKGERGEEKLSRMAPRVQLTHWDGGNAIAKMERGGRETQVGNKNRSSVFHLLNLRCL